MDRPSNTPQPRDRPYRGFNLYCEPIYSLWSIETLDGSRLPTVLSMKWTNRKWTEKAVDAYLESKEHKKINNGTD